MTLKNQHPKGGTELQFEYLEKYVDKNYDIDKGNKILDDYSLYIQKRDKTEKKYGKLTDL